MEERTVEDKVCHDYESGIVVCGIAVSIIVLPSSWDMNRQVPEESLLSQNGCRVEKSLPRRRDNMREGPSL